MHIPDGYLSPLTCATMYGAATPFWYTSLRRVQKVVNTRTVPLLSLFAAFSFVVMLFNLPLPGGTTGHAVGVALATIVLGPWASMLATSVALLIQALFFGDGGITALGANCFNMAIAGSLVAYAVYRLIAGRAALASRRRVVAAAAAGYASINVAALLAAVEFGIQPLLYRDPTGAPLYAPYGLGIAVPAMMIGHLTIAGFAELALSAGVVSFLQRTDVSLLQTTAPAEVRAESAAPRAATLRPLWVGLALLLLLTPLGVLAVGSAWGEWTAADYGNPAIRQQITHASGNQAPPPQAPAGMQRFASVWTAPFPAYAPPILRNQKFSYLLSAMFGAGLIIALIAVAGRVLGRSVRTESQ